MYALIWWTKTFGLFVLCSVMVAEAIYEADLRRTLAKLLKLSNEHERITVQGLLEAPPESIMTLPAFQQLARNDSRELLTQIGEWHLFGDGPVPQNATHAELFLQASATYGSAQAQFLLGTQRAIADDDMSAHLYYEFAAQGHSIAASMALGYNAMRDYYFDTSCLTALRHYETAASRVLAEQKDQTFQLFKFPLPVRLSETEGAEFYKNSDVTEGISYAEFLRQQAKNFDNSNRMARSARITLFNDLYDGVEGFEPEEHRAREEEALRFLEHSVKLGNIEAHALLGHVYAHGLAGCSPNVTRAVELYEYALNASQAEPDGEAANGLGIIYSRGMGDVLVDPEKALEYFLLAVDVGHSGGIYNAALAYLEMGPIYSMYAENYFDASSKTGHLKSLFQLARLKEQQVDSFDEDESMYCEEALDLYKQVAEYSREGIALMSRALEYAQRGNWVTALELYLVAAEMGYEVAQSNALWLIERLQRQLFGTLSNRDVKDLERLHSRLLNFALEQYSGEALLRIGDKAFQDGDYKYALRNYRSAFLLSDGKCARALYNLGYMNEYGLGMEAPSLEDASSFYHFAGEENPSLRLVMTVLKFKLYVQSSFQQFSEMVYRTWMSLTHEADVSSDDISSSTTAQSVEGEPVSTSYDIPTLDQSANQQQTPAFADLSSVRDLGDPDVSNTSYDYAMALQFLGSQSSLYLDIARVEVQQDLTIETWLRIDNVPLPGQIITLVDVLTDFKLELLPAGDSSWMLRFRKFLLTEDLLTLSFPSAPLTPHTWNHVAITFDAASQTVTLLLNAQVKQSQTFHLQSPTLSQSEKAKSDKASSFSLQLMAIGNAIGRAHLLDPFDSQFFIGQLVHFRLWKACKLANEIELLMIAHHHEVSSQDLLVNLRYEHNDVLPVDDVDESSPKSMRNRVKNGKRSVIRAQGLQVEMVEFPPLNEL